MDQSVLSVGIVGNGFVGKATSLLLVERARNFTGTRIKLFVYDASPSLCNPPDTTLSIVANCDLVFVCVPTPMLHTGACDTSIVESVVAELRAEKSDCNIVVRSTVPPGTSKRLKVSFMPEFLTEKSWAEDVYSCETWVFGFDCELGRNAADMIETVLKNARSAGYISSARLASVSTTEAEMIKYTRNTFLATKVSLFNEIHALCVMQGKWTLKRCAHWSSMTRELERLILPYPDMMANGGSGEHAFRKIWLRLSRCTKLTG
jgi:UDPglucose 6-dehydrogenase